jgi:hypothetical protein
MFIHKYISRTSSMYYILVGLMGTCFIFILLADWSHKTERLPFFYIDLQKRTLRTPFCSSNVIYHRGSRHYNECQLLEGEGEGVSVKGVRVRVRVSINFSFHPHPLTLTLTLHVTAKIGDFKIKLFSKKQIVFFLFVNN